MPPTSPRPSETRRADISDVPAISRKSGVKTVRSRVMLIRRTPWSQGLRCDLECLSFLINFLRRRILHPVISERMGGNPLPQCARSCSDMKRREARRPQREGCRCGTESRLNPRLSERNINKFRVVRNSTHAPDTICTVLHSFAPECTA